MSASDDAPRGMTRRHATRMAGRFRSAMLLAAMCVSIAASGREAHAQGFLQLWAGVGSSTTQGSSTFGKGAKQVGVQVSVPLLPISLRGDALLLGNGIDTDALSYSLNVVLRMSFPLIQPYAIGGRGTYARSPDEKAGGWNLGGGLRVGIGELGVFAEIRRHTPVKRTITVVGVTF